MANTTESAAAGITKGLLPIIAIGGLIALVWWKRDAIAGWFRGAIAEPITSAPGDFWEWLKAGGFFPPEQPEQVSPEVAAEVWSGYWDAKAHLAASDVTYQEAKAFNAQALKDWAAGAPLVLWGQKPAEETAVVTPQESQMTQGAPVGSQTAAVLEANRTAFNQLPTSYDQIKHLDIVADRNLPDYERGDYRLYINQDAWGLYQHQQRSYGWDWLHQVGAGGSQAAVWHNNQFLGALNVVGITDWRG